MMGSVTPHEPAPGLAAKPVAAAGSSPLSGAELRQRFTERLRVAELLPALELDLNDKRWVLRGDLGPEEDRRLERVVAAFFSQNRPDVEFEATIVPAEQLLPFRIGHISSGKLAHVVTSDGHRLFVGDSHAGYTLAQVEAHRLVFTGKRRIEVAW